MPSGEQRLCRRRARGFTYLWLLFVVALVATAMAGAGQHWRSTLQRERETELSFRGAEIARAIAAFRAVSVDGRSRGPESLAELVNDHRGIRATHHLRQLYADPMTGKADWVLMMDDERHIRGVHSRSDARAFITKGTGLEAAGSAPRVSDRVFSVDDAAVAPPPHPAASAGVR